MLACLAVVGNSSILQIKKKDDRTFLEKWSKGDMNVSYLKTLECLVPITTLFIKWSGF